MISTLETETARLPLQLELLARRLAWPSASEAEAFAAIVRQLRETATDHTRFRLVMVLIILAAGPCVIDPAEFAELMTARKGRGLPLPAELKPWLMAYVETYLSPPRTWGAPCN